MFCFSKLNSLFKKVLLLSFLTSSIQFFGQSVPRCFSKDELLEIQKQSIEDITIMLEKSDWVMANESGYNYSKYLDYDLGYERTIWTKYSDKFNYVELIGAFRNPTQRFVVFHAEGKPNIIVFVPRIYNFDIDFALIQQLENYGYAGEFTSYDGSACFKRLQKGSTPSEYGSSKMNISQSKKGNLSFYFYEPSDEECYILIYDENAYNREVQAIEDRKNKFDKLVTQGDSLFGLNQFSLAQARYTEANDVEASSYMLSKIEACREGTTAAIKSSADSLYKLQDYAGAKRKYQEALSFHSQSKLSASLKESMRQCSIHILRNEAQNFYESNELKRALDRYNSLLELDNNDQDAKEKITHIQNTIEFLKKRESVTYSYRETQKEDYNRLCRDLLTTINSGIDESLNGQLKGSIKIEFDTSGRNLSSIQNLHTSLNDALILGSLKGASLTPTKFFGYHAASKETIEISSDWNSSFSTLKFKKKGISGNNLPSQTISTIQNFASKNEIYQGKCEVAIKSKNFNNSKYVDIDLIRYKPVGPEAALYSLVLPGLGSYKATTGRKGLLRFESFLVSAGIAVGAEMLSRNTYDEYLAANEPQKMNDLYNKANLYHKISLVAAGLTASIYVYELVDAFHMGLKNTKRTKYVREELKKKPISIQKQNIDKM